MIPKPITIDGRSGTVLYINDAWEPVEQAEATKARVLFEDGGDAWYDVKAAAEPSTFSWALKGGPNSGRYRKGSGKANETGGRFAKSSVTLTTSDPMHTNYMYQRDTTYEGKAPQGTGFVNPARGLENLPPGKEKFHNNPRMVEAKAPPKVASDLLKDVESADSDNQGGANKVLFVTMEGGTKAVYKPESGEAWGGSFCNHDINKFITNTDFSLAEREATAYEVGQLMFDPKGKDPTSNPVPETVLRESLDIDVPESDDDDESGDEDEDNGYDEDYARSRWESYKEGHQEQAYEAVGDIMANKYAEDQDEHYKDIQNRAEEMADIWNELVKEYPDEDKYGSKTMINEQPKLPLGTRPAFDPPEPAAREVDPLEVIKEAEVDPSSAFSKEEKEKVRAVLKQRLDDGAEELGDVDEDAARDDLDRDDWMQAHEDTERTLLESQFQSFDSWRHDQGMNSDDGKQQHRGGGGGGRIRNQNAPHPKGGSLQKFVEDLDFYGSPSEAELTKAAMLDYAVGSMDRHGHNAAYADDKPVAMDNGYSMPGSRTPDGFQFRSAYAEKWLNTDYSQELNEDMRGDFLANLESANWEKFADKHSSMSSLERSAFLGRIENLKEAMKSPDGLHELWSGVDRMD